MNTPLGGAYDVREQREYELANRLRRLLAASRAVVYGWTDWQNDGTLTDEEFCGYVEDLRDAISEAEK
jgi:hypothetical protein